MRFWIYRPDVYKINPHLLYSPKGQPYLEVKEKEDEIREKIEEVKTKKLLRKLNTKREW